MISTKAIDIVPLLAEPFDYAEYLAKCRAMDYSALPEGKYAQKLGILMAAQNKYPHLEPAEAYTLFIADINSSPEKTTAPSGKKGCCGGNKTEGGEVR